MGFHGAGVLTLGTTISYKGTDEAALKAALAAGQRAFWAHKEVFKSRMVSSADKFKHYNVHVVPVALSSAGMWTWTQALCQTLISWENGMLRKMIFLRRLPDEDWIHFLRRHSRIAKKIFRDQGNLEITEKALQAILRLAVKVARPSPNLPGAIVSHVLAYRDNVDWENLDQATFCVFAGRSFVLFLISWLRYQYF